MNVVNQKIIESINKAISVGFKMAVKPPNKLSSSGLRRAWEASDRQLDESTFVELATSAFAVAIGSEEDETLIERDLLRAVRYGHRQAIRPPHELNRRRCRREWRDYRLDSGRMGIGPDEFVELAVAAYDATALNGGEEES